MGNISAKETEDIQSNEIPLKTEDKPDSEDVDNEVELCPCLDDLLNGPCGEVARPFFVCMNKYKKEDERQMDCFLKYSQAFSDCMDKHPEIVGPVKDEEINEEQVQDENVVDDKVKQ